MLYVVRYTGPAPGEACMGTRLMIAFPHKEEIAKAEGYQNVSWEQGLVGVGHSAVTYKASLQHLLTV